MYTTAVSYRIPTQTIGVSSLWEVFSRVNSAFRELQGSLPAVYRLWLVDVDQIQKARLSKRKKVVFNDQAQLLDYKRDPLFAIQGEYGEKHQNGESQYGLFLSYENLLKSLVEVRFNGVCLDGPMLSSTEEPIGEQLRAYHLAKELMDRLAAEECWASLDDQVEYQAGYGPYYAHEMVSFHFRREGPQTVIAGLEEGIRPTSEMGDLARRERPHLHGYRRDYLRLIDLPWAEYWARLCEGASVPYRLFTEEDNQRIEAEQIPRHHKATALGQAWLESERLPLNEGFRSLG